MPGRKRPPELHRPTLWDDLARSSRNPYCKREDLSNEASVEAFFVSRLLKDLGYEDSQIKTKESIETLTVGLGHRREKYKPDYALMVEGMPRCVVDAKGTEEDPGKWVEQCSGYCLQLNRKYPANPVRYFVLTNGLSTQVFEWDKEEPILVLGFDDFGWGHPEFEQLRELLSADKITETASPDVVVVPSLNFAFGRPTSERARKLFSDCHQIIWQTEVGSPAFAFMEFVKVMFVKLWADRNLRENTATREFFADDKDSVRLPGAAVTFSTEWIESREAEGAPNPIDSILFEQLREDIERNIQLRKKKRLFNRGERINLRPETVKSVVSKLQHFDMYGIDEDLNGRLFETFLSATMRGRDLGQFFTPRSIVKMMARLADLRADRQHQDKVMDACCGSGGFLIEALTAMRNQVRSNASLSDADREGLMGTISNECLYGIDYGKEPQLSRIARINMYLHGDGGSCIYFADGLDKVPGGAGEKDPEVVQNVQELRENLRDLRFDVVLTNPPFSMARKQGSESERRILEQYDIARKSEASSALRPSVRLSVLYFERYWDLLRPGGKLITVIDETILSSSQFAFVRDFIRSRFLVRAIVSLPGNAFKRQGSRVKTSVLLLEKKKEPSDAQPACFGFFSEYLGVDDLTPRAGESEVRRARANSSAEVEQIVAGYEAHMAGKPSPIVLSPEKIADRLDLKHCVGQFGRYAQQWREEGLEVKRLSECVRLAENTVSPSAHPDTEFTLIKVSYDGECEPERTNRGKDIKAPGMYRVKKGQMVFSTIRATDGAVGVVPEQLDGTLVSDDSYKVFDCGTEEDTAYLWAILRSHELRADMQSLSPGSSRYNTPWPEVGRVLIPWPSDERRREIGKAFLEARRLERQAQAQRQEALGQVAAFGVESEDSVHRWQVSKAPT